MNRTFAVFAILVLAACSGPPGTMPELPNIVVLFVDDLGYYDLGFRNEKFHTPNIDLLASQGMVLENAYTASPPAVPREPGSTQGSIRPG